MSIGEPRRVAERMPTGTPIPTPIKVAKSASSSVSGKRLRISHSTGCPDRTE
jgi:hypothetical protein